MIRRLTEFIFFGSIFISLCVVAMCIETNLLLNLPVNNVGLYVFVFGASLLQYNLHYLIKKTAIQDSARLAWSQRNSHLHKILIAIAVVLILCGLFIFQFHHIITLLVLGFITLIYSFPVLPFQKKKRLKDFGILKIITLSLLWTIVTVWFPAEEALYTQTSFILIFVGRFIFIFILCLAFDIRDAEIDRQENIRTIPVLAGIKSAYNICYISLVIFVLLSVVQHYYHPDVRIFNAMLISAAATFVMIEYTKKNKSDMAYLACVDGMMLLQALLVIIASI